MRNWNCRRRVSTVGPDDYARVVEVWEASVRATHTFVTEADIEVIRPLVWDGLPVCPTCSACATRGSGGGIHRGGGYDGRDALCPSGLARPGHRAAVVELCGHDPRRDELDVNEQNPQALGFYLRMGFEVAGRSAVDSIGKPYPLLHMRVRRD